jgi:hypothetical protein
MSASSSLEHFARVLSNGFAESVDTHSSVGHGDPEPAPPARPARPSTRVLDLVNQALGPLAAVIAQVAAEDAAKEAKAAIKEVPEVVIAADEDEPTHKAEDAAPIVADQPLSESPLAQSIALPEVEIADEPLIDFDEPIEPASERPSFDSAPSTGHASAGSMVEVIEMPSDADAELDKSIGAPSSCSSASDAGTPLFERFRRDSSESAPPSEAGPSTPASPSGGRKQQSATGSETGTGRPWATNSTAWQQRLSIRRDICEDDGESSEDEDDEDRKAARKSFAGHYAQLVADVEEDEEEGDAVGSEAGASDDGGDAYSSSGVEDNVDDSDDDVPLAEAHPGALQAQQSLRDAQGNKRPSPSKRKSQTAPARNPFNFAPNSVRSCSFAPLTAA